MRAPSACADGEFGRQRHLVRAASCLPRRMSRCGSRSSPRHRRWRCPRNRRRPRERGRAPARTRPPSSPPIESAKAHTAEADRRNLAASAKTPLSHRPPSDDFGKAARSFAARSGRGQAVRLGAGRSLKLLVRGVLDRLGEGVRHASIAPVIHVQTVARQEASAHSARLSASSCRTATERARDDSRQPRARCRRTFDTGRVGAFRRVLGVTQQDRNAGGPRRRHALFNRGAEGRFIDAGHRVVRSHLPDHEARPADAKAARSLGNVLAATSPPIPALRTLAGIPSS